MKLTMVGTGYVGLVTGSCLANTGNTVTCLDIDPRKIDLLNEGEVPIYEPGLEEIIGRNVSSGRLHFTTDKAAAYADAEVIFICVGTPPDEDGSADLQHVLAAAADVADAINALAPGSSAPGSTAPGSTAPGNGASPKLVVVKSTVPVGSTHKVRDLIASKTKLPFYIANNPEFLKEGNAVSDFMRPDRVICGVESAEAADILQELYEPFLRQGNPIHVIDTRSSEMVKYASNAMLACKISFVNEIARLCEHYGADVKAVRDGMCADRRIGNQFLYPGLGYGGSCFPKDTLAVIGMGRAAGFHCTLNEAVHNVNQAQRDYFWKKIADHYGHELNGKTLAFWGVAFKPETDDIRQAPSVDLMRSALKAGANVRAYDPAGLDNLRQEIPGAGVTCVDDMYTAAEGCDGLIVCTEWLEFRNPDFDRIGQALKEKVVFDGRNIYRRTTMERRGFTYYSVGRPPVKQPTPVGGAK